MSSKVLLIHCRHTPHVTNTDPKDLISISVLSHPYSSSNGGGSHLALFNLGPSPPSSPVASLVLVDIRTKQEVLLQLLLLLHHQPLHCESSL